MADQKNPSSTEQDKLNAEIELLKSEKAKVDIEKQKIEKEVNKSWFKKERVLQAFFAGIAAVPIMWFFFKEVAIPIYQRENIKLAHENEKVKIKNDKQSDSLTNLRKTLILKDSLAKIERQQAWDELDIQQKEFEESKKRLITKYELIINGIQNENQDIQKLKGQIDDLKEPLPSFTSDLYISEDFILRGEGVEYWETPKNTTLFNDGFPDAIVFHYTGGKGLESSAKWEQRDDIKASIHIIIGRDGRIIQLVPFNTIAWHAGKSEYNGRTGYNKYSIGIEFENVGVLTKENQKFRSWFGQAYDAKDVEELTHKHESSPRYWHKYSEEQIQRAEQVCKLLTAKFSIKEIIGHEDLAPKRKQDPGPAFPLKEFQKKYLE